ncbi:GTPase Era [bacterium]|nr:MAG: GTPase Era [bacterium]
MSGFKSGFTAIIGRTNAGKSTLLNAIVGQKISIISDKVQTTRNTVRGFATSKDSQIVFLDTPGIHKGSGLLGKFMFREAVSSLDGADVIIFLVEADRDVSNDERFIISLLENVKTPVLLVINKIDKVSRQTLLPLIKTYSGLYNFKEVFPISALKGDGVSQLVDAIKKELPEGPLYFPEDSLTDQPERFVVAEMIREKVFQFTRQEVPYSTAVVIESFIEGKKLISISAAINVEKDSQKGILIGKGAQTLKRIGTAARHDIEKLLGVKVFLELFVRVEDDWTKRPDVMKDYGY